MVEDVKTGPLPNKEPGSFEGGTRGVEAMGGSASSSSSISVFLPCSGIVEKRDGVCEVEGIVEVVGFVDRGLDGDEEEGKVAEKGTVKGTGWVGTKWVSPRTPCCSGVKLTSPFIEDIFLKISMFSHSLPWEAAPPAMEL